MAQVDNHIKYDINVVKQYYVWRWRWILFDFE